ncbi:helix-turn-helix transcriptional regulator [Brevundimonas sp.]|jgi:DNA-binding CsgD family transcriptional regulator|uniref:helix-turn-helix transcriptional regulator n=1 Tax=Brevundimonas sp. TaxID=1871086 RepID=UPI00391A7C29
MTHSLDRLSDRERDLLILLAQGHTAKTVARVRGLSVNVVNEQLRSARRKTGAMSSRELARAVAAQTGTPKPCDKKIDLERSVAANPSLTSEGLAIGARKARTVWRMAMSICVLMLAGLLAQQSVTHSAKPGEQGPQVSASSMPAAEPDVVYQVLFLKDGEYLASPTVAGHFGREVRVELPNAMRVVVSAETPDNEGRSFAIARMSLFTDGDWRDVRTMSMRAVLTATPSFEYSVEGTPYRFVVLMRKIVPPAG